MQHGWCPAARCGKLWAQYSAVSFQPLKKKRRKGKENSDNYVVIFQRTPAVARIAVGLLCRWELCLYHVYPRFLFRKRLPVTSSLTNSSSYVSSILYYTNHSHAQMKRHHENMKQYTQIARFLSMQVNLARGLITVAKLRNRAFQTYQ